MNDEREYPPLNEMITPMILKSISDSPQYERAYRNIKFGQKTKGIISQRWVFILLGVVISVVVILYLTGHLPVGGR